MLAYGTYLIADRLGQSGIIATVVAGIVLGTYGRRIGLPVATFTALDQTWEFIAFLLTAFVFLLIGLAITVGTLLDSAGAIALGVVGILVGRAIVVYVILGGASRVVRATGRGSAVPTAWLHVLFWAGLRGAIAIGLALSLPENLPERGHLQGIVFGTFEWAVVAAMSVSAHLAERNYALRFLDAAGEPAFHRSPSAPEPDNEEYSGAGGLQSIAESLAAIQLSGPHHMRRDHYTARREHAGSTEYGQAVFDDRLIDKLAAHRMRGPVLAVLGKITLAEARSLAPAAGYAANAFAIVISDRPAESHDALEALRLGGWRAVAVDASASLPAAWTFFDEGGGALSAAAADVRRGAGVAR